jgi:hypothetical protein
MVRVQFCRWRVIWDKVLAYVTHGKTEKKAVAELELLHTGCSLNQLVNKLKHQRQRQPGLNSL